MLLLCWNVAGWSTTVNRIFDNYSSSTKITSIASSCKQSSPLAEYFRRHGDPMIVCLQEHKIPHQQLSSRSEPRQAATIPGYESFWSCCVDPEKKGLNGTVTYAKTGTVLRADSAPLREPSLDQQGRCVMTDHGKFVVFNVYVPNSGGHPMQMKMKFLKALRRAMQRERREHGKAVILVGDLNISHRAIDIFWSSRTVHIQQVLDQVQAATTQELKSLPQWKRDISTHWANIEKIMETREVVKTTTTNTLRGETYNKYRLKVTLNNASVFLGSHEFSPEYCTHNFDFNAAYYVDEETGERVMTRENRTMSVANLAEIMMKLVNVEWSELVKREIAATDACEPRISPKRQWLTKLLTEDGMIDSFRYFYPKAEGRFTCWHQVTNRRYYNEGARIDYALVDGELLPNLIKGSDLRCCLDSELKWKSKSLQERHVGKENDGKDTIRRESETTDNKTLDCCSEEMALRAATAAGRFQPVSFEGGGIVEASQETLDTQFGPPHTGMIYTPPSYSDHIAISVLFDDSIVSTDLAFKSDSATRKAQPHKVQRTIASFFGPGASTSTDSSGAPKRTRLKQTVVKANASSKAPPSEEQFAVAPTGTKQSATCSSRSSLSKRSSIVATVGGTTKKSRKDIKQFPKSSLLHHFKKQEKE